MADQDSDRWIFEVLALDIRRKMEDREATVQLTDLVAQCLREAHARGITRDDIEGALKIMPMVFCHRYHSTMPKLLVFSAPSNGPGRQKSQRTQEDNLFLLIQRQLRVHLYSVGGATLLMKSLVTIDISSVQRPLETF